MDRCRDRWPMSLLVSRVKMFNLMEENKPRDVRAALTGGKREGGVAMLAEVGSNERNKRQYQVRATGTRAPRQKDMIRRLRIWRRSFLVIAFGVPHATEHNV